MKCKTPNEAVALKLRTNLQIVCYKLKMVLIFLTRRVICCAKLGRSHV